MGDAGRSTTLNGINTPPPTIIEVNTTFSESTEQYIASCDALADVVSRVGDAHRPKARGLFGLGVDLQHQCKVTLQGWADTDRGHSDAEEPIDV